MMRKIFFAPLLAVLACLGSRAFAQPVSRSIRTAEYRELQKKLSTGWNTWYNNSFTSFVHLPQGFSINLCFTQPGDPNYLKETFKEAAIHQRPEKLVPGLRADDGFYTSMKLTYKEEDLQIQSATDGNDELILVSPPKNSKNYLILEAGLLWNREGSIGMHNNRLQGVFGGDSLSIGTTALPVSHAYAVTTAPHISFSLENEIGIYTGKTRTLTEIKAVIQNHHDLQQKRMDAFGDLSGSFTAMQTILAWNTVYDAPNNRVITPVSRKWSNGWGGFVLFDWDTYFASYMLSSFNKELAYANAIEITKSVTPQGFIPNYQSPFGNTSWDRSEPPVGSAVILWIYNKFKEKWFLTEVYDELLSWNRWWAKTRDVQGYLCWGSSAVPDTLKSIENHNAEAAKLESGLDNSPMYDSIPFNPRTSTLELADVGLMSMYIADCNSLAEIATILGRKAEAAELKKRSAYYGKQLAGLWDEKTGIFLNKRMDNGEKSYRLSPTNFYPMLAKVCTEQQAARMIKDHYYNPNEFYGKYVIPSISRNDPAFRDNDYWRGRIWGPMNFLLYMGMRNYALPEARADLISKSKELLMQNWKEDGGVYENYNAVTGAGGDVNSADGFYHWGALLSFIEFVERGKE